MNCKLITAITTEPVTLTEVHAQLRLSSISYADDLTTYQSIAPGSHIVAAAYSLVGASVDVLGKRAIVNLNSGTNGASGTVDAKIQESDNNSTWTDWTGGAFTQVTTANDNAIQEKEYTGSKRYIRVVATVAVIACEFSVDILVDTGVTAEDTLLSSLITVAREYCEAFTGRGLANQTRELILDSFPSESFIELPYSPIQSVTSIKYKDSDATETTMTATTEYLTNLDTTPGLVVLPYAYTWPSFTEYPTGAVRIRYVCGYSGVTPDIIPTAIKQAMLLLITHLYEHRGAVEKDNYTEMPFAVKSLLWPYKIFTL